MLQSQTRRFKSLFIHRVVKQQHPVAKVLYQKISYQLVVVKICANWAKTRLECIHWSSAVSKVSSAFRPSRVCKL